MQDIIFVHIPRTGGETIEILLEIKKNHYQVRHRLPELQGSPENKHVFSFVRNPYTRLYSWYSHLRRPLYINEVETTKLDEKSYSYLKSLGISKGFRGQVNFGPPSGIHFRLALKYNFNDWVKIMMSDKNKYTEASLFGKEIPRMGPLITCYDFLCDKKIKKIVVDNIYYFENYNEELIKLLTKIDRKDLIPKIEVTNQSKRPVPGEISEETKEMIYDHFEIDFTTFGYEK